MDQDNDLPIPLVSPEVDLRGLPFMPLDTARLIDSDLFSLSSGGEFKAAVALWCKSWQQVPAASLPSDDRILARLSGAGARWPKVKAMALRGFILCSDGRYYHSVIAVKAIEAWKHRVRQRERAAKRWHSDGNAAALPEHSHGNAAAYPTVMQGTVKVEKESKNVTLATTEPHSEKPSLGEKAFKIEGFGSGGSVSGSPYANQRARDEYATNECLKHLPIPDIAERNLIAMAAEDPSMEGHDRACRLMRQAAEIAGVGWVSPGRRKSL